MLVHKDRGQWEEFGPAFYTAHLELYLGNGCLGESRILDLQQEELSRVEALLKGSKVGLSFKFTRIY